LDIQYVETGLGNNFGTHIELNKNLKEYPKLHDAILNHELRHTDKLFTWKDLKNDLTENNVNSFEVLKFMLKYPKSFTQVLPFYFSKKHGFVYDINLIFIYLVCIGIIGVALFISSFI